MLHQWNNSIMLAEAMLVDPFLLNNMHSAADATHSATSTIHLATNTTQVELLIVKTTRYRWNKQTSEMWEYHILAVLVKQPLTFRNLKGFLTDKPPAIIVQLWYVFQGHGNHVGRRHVGRLRARVARVCWRMCCTCSVAVSIYVNVHE